MTKDEIIRMAREAGMPMVWISNSGVLTWTELIAFANLVAAAEREACAKLCEAQGEYGWQQYADAIRARGQA